MKKFRIITNLQYAVEYIIGATSADIAKKTLIANLGMIKPESRELLEETISECTEIREH